MLAEKYGNCEGGYPQVLKGVVLKGHTYGEGLRFLSDFSI